MIRILVLLMFLPFAAGAQEFISTQGPLSDEDFYRVISCAAKPGEPCQKEIVKWNRGHARKLTVSLYRMDDGFPPQKAGELNAALDNAIQAINAAGARIKLVRVANGKPAKIRFYLMDQGYNTEISGTNIKELDGTKLGAAHTRIWWKGSKQILKSVLLFTNEISSRAIESIVLEQLTQSLGLMTNIENPYYQSRSIFAERNSTTKTLSGQDVTVLRRHYP